MSRLLLSSVLVALVAGLTLLACIPDPVETEWLGKVGDEFQITDDAVEQHDPVFYNTENYDSIEEAQIAYHDGSSIYLYDIPSKSTDTLYQTPDDYTITAMCAMNDWDMNLYDLVFVIDNGAESIVLREANNVVNELYRDSGDRIDNIIAYYQPDTEKDYLLLERDGQIHVFMDGVLVDVFEGKEPGSRYMFIFYVDIFEGKPCIYVYEHNLDSGGYHTPYYTMGGVKNYPTMFQDIYTREYLCFTSYTEGDTDIWVRSSSAEKICEVMGTEKELCGWLNYIVFTRTVNGQADIHIIKGNRR